MTTNFADRWAAAWRRVDAPVCVGIDPVLEKLPAELRPSCNPHPILPLEKGEGGSGGAPHGASKSKAIGEALCEFGRSVIDHVAGLVPAVKINVAFFEAHYTEGIAAYYDLVKYAKEAGLLVIGDVKRADVGHSCAQYAAAHLGVGESARIHGIETPDAVTVNPYLGADGVEPFAEIAEREGKGVFVLVQTSNPSAAEIQGIRLAEGCAFSEETPTLTSSLKRRRGNSRNQLTMSEYMARKVQEWATRPGRVGPSGYSCIGAVVSPGPAADAARLRELMPNCLFLVPGYGAQGRSAEDIIPCFDRNGGGAIVNASRQVIYAYQDARYRDRHGDDWCACIESACKDFVADIRGALSGRH
jgi:orotidine-5'-phosphate decarboxylase